MPFIFLLSANFIFYITFVQFGLLRMINGRFGLSIESLGLPLGLMALTGALASVSTGYLIDKYSLSLRRIFHIASIISILEGAVAIYSMAVFNRDSLPPLFVVLGLLMGINGVLVIRVVEAWPVTTRGLMAGCAMALVYLAANIIAGFVSTPERVALICGIVTVINGVLCLPYPLQNPPSPPFAKGENFLSPPLKKGDQGGLSYLKVIVILAGLVAVDSFVFHIETNREELYRYTWEGRWLWNGIVHAVTAIAAGVIWDKRGERPVFAIMLSAFALALILLALFPIGYFTGFISTLFYNTAVSFYGIMMIVIWYYIAPEIGTGLKIGTGMAFAGWVASPLGIGLAIKTASAPVNVLLIGPLIVVMFLVLINLFFAAFAPLRDKSIKGVL
ncbi:MAG: MFS transporter [Deltaproteobacteria bacterium]